MHMVGGADIRTRCFISYFCQCAGCYSSGQFFYTYKSLIGSNTDSTTLAASTRMESDPGLEKHVLSLSFILNDYILVLRRGE